MKQISWFGVLAVLMPMASGAAGYSNSAFQREVKTGLDLVGARANVDVLPDTAPGELGADVYQTVGAADNADTQMFIPTTMYVRMGAGLNLGFATDRRKLAMKNSMPVAVMQPRLVWVGIYHRMSGQRLTFNPQR